MLHFNKHLHGEIYSEILVCMEEERSCVFVNPQQGGAVLAFTDYVTLMKKRRLKQCKYWGGVCGKGPPGTLLKKE